MTKLNQIYKCSVCGNMVEVVHASGGELVCCGQPMTLQNENTVEASKEKHIPIVEKLDNEIVIKVGSIEHPMEEKHYIEWIELLVNNKVYRKHLKPGDKPEARFKVQEELLIEELQEEIAYCEGSPCNFVCKDECGNSIEFTVREYCNIHGLWRA